MRFTPPAETITIEDKTTIDLDWVAHDILTKKVQQTFHGYAMAQLKKIKTHRSWLLNPPTKKPSREDFGLPIAGETLSRDDQNRIEQSIADKIRSYGIHSLMTSAAGTSGAVRV